MQNHRGNAMRLITVLFMSCLCSAAFADQQPKPADLQALPPPSLDANEPVDEPQVTITKQTEQTVEEFRVAGKLYMIKITPKVGKPYYLVDDVGDGKFSRHEGLDSGVRPPRWVLFRF
jgi:hypothetical protein